ncbi:MAG TPA: hypothetical protein VLL08_15305 [Kineosporiaceae bacterium]|nr:hypothetical protein [Kineosporiaceae bacterium]
MSRKQPLDFRIEVQRSFQFLVAAYGMSDPEYSEFLLPSVHYQRPDLQVQVVLQTRDGAGTQITVGASLPNRNWPARADLPDLVEAAVFAPRHLVPGKAHTRDAPRTTLEANATWLDRLMPLLLGSTADALMRRANEHQVDRAGNPKRRHPGMDWKYT